MRKSKLIHTLDAVFEAVGLCNYIKGPSKIAIPWKKSIKRTGSGFEVHMKFPIGKSMADVERAYDAIVVALNGADIRLGRKGGWLVMDIYSEPLPSFIPFTSEMLQATYQTWKVPVMYTQDGMIYHDFSKWPSLKIGGATRKGKTVAIKMITTTLLHNHAPDKIHMTLIDGKRFASFQKYGKFPHIFDTGYDVPSTSAAMDRVRKELDDRMNLLRKKNVEDVIEYEETYGEALKRHFIIVDEGFMFRTKDAKGEEDKALRKNIESTFEELASLGAGPGFHLIYCTQRPDAETIPPLVRANIEATLAFRTATPSNSDVLLDNEAAYKLPDIRGRAVYQTDRAVVGQVPYLGNWRAWWLLFELSSSLKKLVNKDEMEMIEWVEKEEESETILVK